MVWPFNRSRKNKDTVPQEVQEYYQSERRERVGIAWVLALTTLVVTILLALGLFFGGRWAYRQLFGNNGTIRVTDDESQQTDDSDTPAESDRDEDSNSEDIDEPDPSATGDDSTGNDETSGSNSGGTSDSQNETPSTGADQELPDTGPGDNPL